MTDAIYGRTGTNVPLWMPSGDMLTYLPGLNELIAERDAALERWVDFLVEHDDVLSPNWQRIAEQRDTEAARKAVAEGRNPMAGKNSVTEAAGKRARALGAAQEMANAVRELDTEILAVLRSAADDAVGPLESDLGEAEAAYEGAYADAMRARARFTQLAYLRWWVDTVQHGSNREPAADFRPNGALTAGPYERGSEETRVVRAKLADALNHEERVAVDMDGETKVMPKSLAQELVDAGLAKFHKGF